MPAVHLQRQRNAPSGRSIGLLSTFPPKLCGLATFAAALEAELATAGEDVVTVAIDDGRNQDGLSRARHELVNGMPSSVREIARVLSRCDVAVIQHEYGIYGGPDGDEIVDLLEAVTAPSVVVLHTVPLAPSPHQRSVLEAICGLASRVVVMTAAAGTRLVAVYAVDATKVMTIPHGAAPPVALRPRAADEFTARRPHLLTWGLLGPGKGIEHMVHAMLLLQDVRPRIHYTVAGATHPNVFAREGDRYRQSLVRNAWATGVASSIGFDDTYRDVRDLMRVVASASLVVLPYDSHDQVTSGVLVDAIGAGKPVIATAFPHALELLSDGAGIVVPHGDPAALAAAIRSVVTDPARLEAMTRRALELAPTLTWQSVATRYRDVFDDLAAVDAAVAI